MNRKKVDLIWLWSSIVSFLLLAISFLLMAVDTDATADSISAYTLMAGLVFWGSILMGIVTQCVLAHRRKQWYAINRVRKAKSAHRIGIFSFFKNTYATVADIVAILSLIGVIVAMIVTRGMGLSCYITVSLFVFSFSMHCILNGKIYFHVINQNKLLQVIEKERANSSK